MIIAQAILYNAIHRIKFQEKFFKDCRKTIDLSKQKVLIKIIPK